jgi:hypothetical protein
MVGERFMGSMDPFLKFGFEFLAACLETLHPDEKGLPVNAQDDLKRQEGILQGKVKEVAVIQGNTLTGQHADQFTLSAPVVIDEHLKSLSGKVKPKFEFKIEIGERRDIEMLDYAASECPVLLQGHQIRFPFTECVANLGHCNQWRSFRVVAVVNRDRIEEISGNPGECQEQNLAHGFRDAVCCQIPVDIFAKGRGPMADMITFTKAVETGSIDFEKSRRGGKFRKFV